MLKTGFSVQGTSLKLLRSHERGMITRINTLCDTTVQKMRQLGLTPGRLITIEQRSPRFIVRVGNDRHALDDRLINSIYVRVLEH
jgi:ferrous iron transport protein A